MNAYTRRPSRLTNSVFTAFDDNIEKSRKPHINKQSKEEVCFELGDSLMALDMEDHTPGAEVGDANIKGKIKIPSMFLGERKITAKSPTGDCNLKAANESIEEPNSSTVKVISPADTNHSNAKGNQVIGSNHAHAKRNQMRQDGSNEDAVLKSTSNKELNRPASKLIQDSNNLPQLFDSLHGKEAEQPVSKRVGRLTMPGIFGSTKSDNSKTAEKQVENDEKTQLLSGKETSFNSAVEMQFSDWKNVKEQETLSKLGGEETFNFKHKSASFNASRQNNTGISNDEKSATTVKDAFTEPSANLKIEQRKDGDGSSSNRISKINDAADTGVNAAKRKEVNQGNSHQLSSQKDGKNQNNQSAMENYRERLNQSTSNSQRFCLNDSQDSLVAGGILADALNTGAVGMRNQRGNRPGFESNASVEKYKSESDEPSSRDSEDGTATDGKMKKGIGKLRMPETFSNLENSRHNQKNQLGSVQRNGKQHFNNRSVDNGSKANTTKVFVDNQGDKESSSTGSAARGFGKPGYQQIKNQNQGLSNERSAPTGGSKEVVSRSQWAAHEVQISKNEVENVNSDVRKMLNSQPADSETDDSSAKNGSDSHQKPQRQVGRLNLKSIFHDAGDGAADKSKDNEQSLVRKNKAVFDKKAGKTQNKQGRAGKLKLSSSKSDLDEELENLQPEGEVPSNMSSQMKLQLEKILQQRSASISSQNSLNSPRNEGRDSRSSRLSMSSSSSLGSPRFSNSFSSDSNLLRYTMAQQESDDSEDVASPKKVNGGTLQSQLDGIFQARQSGGSSIASSSANSLDVSLNSSIVDEADSSPSKSKEGGKDDRQEKRKLIADAIKLKYGGKNNGGNNGGGNNGGGNNDDEETSGGTVDGGKESLPPNTSSFERHPNDNSGGHSGTKPNPSATNNSGTKLDTSENVDSSVNHIPKNGSFHFKEKENDNDTKEAGFDQDNQQIYERGKKRGKLSIPGIFAGKSGTTSDDIVAEQVVRKTRSSTTSTVRKESGNDTLISSEAAKNSVFENGNHVAENKTSVQEDRVNSTEKQATDVIKATGEARPGKAKKLNIPSNFLSDKEPKETGKGDSRPKAVSFVKKSAYSSEGNGNMEVNLRKEEMVGREKFPEDATNNSNDGVKFEEEDGLSEKPVSGEPRVDSGRESSAENATDATQQQNASAQEERKRPAGRLSASLFSAFQNNDNANGATKNRNEKSNEKPKTLKNWPKDNGESIDLKASKQIEVTAVSRQGTGCEASKEFENVNQVEVRPGVKEEESSSGVTKHMDVNNNDAPWTKNDETEAKLTEERQEIFKEDRQQSLSEDAVVNKKKVGKLSIPFAFK